VTEKLITAALVVPWVACAAGWAYVSTVVLGASSAARWVAGRG
jgi:hypothetical protein